MENMTFHDPNGNLISVTYRLVTPAQAQVWLENNNVKNRNLSLRNADKLKKDLMEDRFVFTGDPIRFDKDGVLVDGQHRLHSIVSSGKSVYLLVIEGLDMSATDRIDQGLVRSVADILQMTGRHVTNVSTCVSIGNVLSYGYPDTTEMSLNRSNMADYIWAHREQYQSIAAWAKAASTQAKASDLVVPAKRVGGRESRSVVSGPLASLVLIMIEKGGSEDSAKAFFDAVCSGVVPGPVWAPAIQATRAYLRVHPLARSAQSGSSDISFLYRTFDTLINAYNRTMKGENVKIVKNPGTSEGIRWIEDIARPIY